jgi:hypothetical protein
MLPPFYNRKKEATGSSETLVPVYKTERFHTPQHHNGDNHRCENLKNIASVFVTAEILTQKLNRVSTQRPQVQKHVVRTPGRHEQVKLQPLHLLGQRFIKRMRRCVWRREVKLLVIIRSLHTFAGGPAGSVGFTFN